MQCTGPFTDALALAPGTVRGAEAMKSTRCLRDLRIAGGASQLSHHGVRQLLDRCASILWNMVAAEKLRAALTWLCISPMCLDSAVPTCQRQFGASIETSNPSSCTVPCKDS